MNGPDGRPPAENEVPRHDPRLAKAIFVVLVVVALALLGTLLLLMAGVVTHG